LVGKGYNKSFIAKLFDTTRQTVHRWCNKTKHFKDKKRKAKTSKVTLEVELSILGLRTMFEWGTARIQQALKSLPKFMRDALGELGTKLAQGVELSRTAINNLLRKHKLNGYKRKHKAWKFFRAKRPNELWQLDLKGPFTVEGKKYYFAIAIDDYSRYLLISKEFDYCPDTEELEDVMKPLIKKHKPKKILTDNGPQFKQKWEEFCKENEVKPLLAHPYYPQDKGKVERTIRNVAEEIIYLIKKFPKWLHKLSEYRNWFNTKRYHHGIKGYPAELYKCNVRNLT
jgi:transposase InsO family protein